MTFLYHLFKISPRPLSVFLSVSIAAVFLGGCLEEPIPYNLSDTELYLDTLTISSMAATTFRSPPELGSSETLHLGRENGFKSQFVLIKISSRSLYPYVDLDELADSAFTVDSSFMVITYEKDTLDINNSFRLSYFPNSTDSLFSENESNYLNPTYSELSLEAVNIGETSMVQDPADTTAEENPPYLKYSISSSILEYLDDTSNVNYTFMLTAVDSIETLVGFESHESDNEPQLTVYYHKQETDTATGLVTVDTTSSVYSTAADLSFIEPPSVTNSDTTDLAIGRGNGFKVLLKLGIDSLDVPPATTVRKASLKLYVTDDDSAEGFKIIGFPLSDSLTSLDYSESNSDPYSTLTNYYISGSVSGGKVELDLKSYIQAIVFGRISNNGVKLYSSLTNDSFDFVHLVKTQQDSLAPILKVQYVAP